MITDLRKKFILVSMCSMMIVLLGIVGGILSIGYKRIESRADRVLAILAENNGKFPDSVPDSKPPEIHKKNHREFQFSPEAPYETRYFSVTLDENGNSISTQTGNIAAVQDEDAAGYAETVWKKNRKTGFYKNYRFYQAKGKETTVFFVDCSSELDGFYGTLLKSFIISLFGSFLVLVLLLLLSKKVFRPVEESYEKQKQFITDASHELKTPLTIIDANTEVLEMTEGENEWTASIRKQVKRLAYLTQQMVTLTRMEESRQAGEMSILPLSRVMEEATEPFCQVAEREGKKLILSIEPEISGRGNEEMLFQLVSLLLDNALKYSLPGSGICFRFRKKGRRAELSVLNETRMISKGNLDILFERFYRTDASRSSETGGSGLGLSVAKAIVQAHKGKIHAFSADGKTIVFTALWER